MMKKIALVILLAGMQTHAYAQSVPTKAQVNAEILNTINANGRNGITGPILQADLVQMLAVSASWQGTWGSSVFYSYGEIVSYSGSLWFANTPTLGTPPGSVAGQWTQFSVAAGVITPGTTLIVGGTPGDIEYNNNGVLGEKGTTGSGSVVLSTSPRLTTPDLGTPSAANLANATNLPIVTGVSGLGANVADSLAIDIGSAGSVVTNGGALGTPSSGDAGNLTGLPISTGVSGLGIGVAAALSNPLNGSGGVLGTSLASADLFIGNGSGIAAGVPMSGDATISNSGALTLATSGVTAATYGDSTHSTQVTFDAKGRATSASSVTITHASGDLAAANNLSDVASASTSRTNLGLGNLATQNAGTGLAISAGNLNLQPGTASTIGGVKANAGTTGQFVSGVAADGSLVYSTPSGAGNVTGTGTSVVGNVLCANNTTATALVDCGYAKNAIPAANLSYTAPGTGGIARTQAAKNGELISTADYGAVSDLVQITGNVSITSGTATLTVSGASFASGDVGKAIKIDGAGSAGAPLQTTISAFTSSTQVTLAANASTTLSAVSESVWYGTDNTTALNNWLAACRGAATCYANAGSYGFTGNLSVTAGALIVGAGQGVSNFFNLSPTNNAFVVNTNARVEIYDLSVYSPAYTSGVTGANIYITGSTQNFGSIIRGVSTNGGIYGIDAVNASVLRIDAVDIEGSYVGVNLSNNNAPGSGGYLITNSNIACSPTNPGSYYTALQISNAGNLALSNSMLHFCQNSVVVSLNNTSIPIGDLFFSNNSFEQDTVSGMTFIQGAAGAITQTVMIRGNDFGGGTPTGIFLGDSNSAWLEDTVITGNVFYPNGGTGVHVSKSASLGGIRIGENIFAQGGGTTTGILIDSGAVGTSGDNVFRGVTTTVTNNATGTWTNTTN